MPRGGTLAERCRAATSLSRSNFPNAAGEVLLRMRNPLFTNDLAKCDINPTGSGRARHAVCSILQHEWLAAPAGCALVQGKAVRLFFACVFVIALVVVVAQLRAGPEPSPEAAGQDTGNLPLAVRTQFPEPISTIFILGGAAAMGLWKVAQKLRII